jgi:hypothetical protein
MEKKSFVFYISWNEAIKEMNEPQVRNFINNLCNYAEGKDVVLNDLTERIMWSQTQPLLDYNEGKRQKRIENGRKGGLSKVTPTNQNQVQSTPLNSTNQNEVVLTPLTEEGRGLKEDGRRLKEEGRGLKEEGRELKEDRTPIIKKLLRYNKQLIEEGLVTVEQIETLSLTDARYILNDMFYDTIPDWEDKLNKKGYEGFSIYLRQKNIELDYILDAAIKTYQLL